MDVGRFLWWDTPENVRSGSVRAIASSAGSSPSGARGVRDKDDARPHVGPGVWW